MIMRDHQQQTEFLKRCLRYDESAGREKLEQEITQMQRDERCVQRAAWFMAVLAALAAAGLAYQAILLENFPYGPPQFMVNVICTLGMGSLISLLAFLGLGISCRKKLDQRREECRQMITRLLAARLGNPAATPWREGSVSHESRGPAQTAGGGNGSTAGMESASQG